MVDIDVNVSYDTNDGIGNDETLTNACSFMIAYQIMRFVVKINENEPSFYDRAIQTTVQISLLYLSVGFSIFLAKIEGLPAFVLYNGGVFFIYLCVLSCLLIVSRGRRFDYWKNTSIISFFFSGLWVIIFTGIFGLLFGNISMENEGMKRSLIVCCSIFSTSLLVVIEFTFVFSCNLTIISTRYMVGYTFYVKIEEIQLYLCTVLRNMNLSSNQTVSGNDIDILTGNSGEYDHQSVNQT
jgi:hypothetical protein